MTTLREAAQQALEALELIDKEFKKHGRRHWPEAVKAHSAIAPLRAALAEPVQEPVHEHEKWCASVTQLLLCDPPRKAPCNCKPTAPPQRKPLTVMELQDALIYSNLIDPDAVNDPEGYDEGSTLAQIDELHRIIEKAHGIGEKE